MHATLLAQPVTWARFTQARCAISPSDHAACQQRRVMPTFGGRIHGVSRADPACLLPTMARGARRPDRGRTPVRDGGDGSGKRPVVPIARIEAGHTCRMVATALGCAVVPTARIKAEHHKKYMQIYL
jgi:hypothetical protein